MKKNEVNNIDNKLKIIVVLLIIVFVLIAIRIGISSYKSSKIDVEITENDDKEQTTFEDVIENWGNLYQESKSYEIEEVTIGDIKGTLSIEYTYNGGVKSFVIKHNDTVLISDERKSNDNDYVLTYLGIYKNEYLIWEEQGCSGYGEDNTICLPGDAISLHIVNYDINEILNEIDNYYIYDIDKTDDIIKLKVLSNEYKIGTWSCDSSTSDIQRIYSLSIDENKITTNMVSSVTSSQYCSGNENIVIDWE